MLKAVTNISSDAAIATRHLLSGVFLLSGFNVCIAAGAFVAGATLHGTFAGIKNFFAVMNYSSVELISPIPEMIAAFNWTTLAAMGIFAAYSAWLYVSEAARRTPATAKVVAFPTRETVHHDEKIAA
jgi:hypothetical protein